jgi:hypothetical protein
MTHLSVANQVNHDVFVKLLSELSSKFEGSLNVFHTISIYMENWCVDRLGNVGRVHTRSCFIGRSGETNLVVYYDVNGTSDFVVFKILHLKRFKNYALSSESSITVNYNRNNPLSFFFASAEEVLFSTSSSHDNWIDTFKMGRICK